MNYVKNWGIYVGSFDENELRQNLDKKKIREMQEKYPKLQYINYHMVEVVVLKEWRFIYVL